MSQKHIIFVAGMHRSGTSATTRFLAELGAALPEDLLPAAKDNNPMGFWESERVVTLNNDLLAALNMTWHSPGPVPSGCWESGALKHFEKPAENLLQEFLRNAEQIVVKDPRISRSLPFWLARAEAVNARVGVVIPTRHPLEVARSLATRDGFSEAKSFLLWLRYNLEVERNSRNIARAFVPFDRLLTKPQIVSEETSASLGVSWLRDWVAAKPFLDSFLTFGSKRQNATEDQLGDLPIMVRELFDSMTAGSESLPDTVDRITTDLSRADDVMGVHVNELDTVAGRQRRKIERLQRAMRPDQSPAPHGEPELGMLNSELKGGFQRLEDLIGERSEATLRATDMLGMEVRRAIKHSTEQLISATLERERLLNDVEVAHRHCTELSNSLQTRDREIVILQRRIQHLDVVVSSEANARQQLERSFSWRLTIPIRGLVAILHRLLPRDRKLRSDIAELKRSDWFDADWYCLHYPDVRSIKMSAAEHYCRYGWREGRDPGPAFSTRKYLTRYPDVAKRNMNPLLHYLRHGMEEGRKVK